MTRWPSLFVSHGAPTYAIEPGLAGAQLGALGRLLGKPRAIVVVSPHWMTSELEITATERAQTVHDFGGFPRSLYDLQYPAPGAPALALQIQQQLAKSGMPAHLDVLRGLDHGAWVPLLHLYPDADVPTLQVSLPYDANPNSAYALGQALAPLADDGVLIIGSGSLTHNLYEVRMSASEEGAAEYAQEFSAWIRQAVAAGDLARLRQALDLAPHAARAHPTTEHFLPLLVAAGAALEHTPVTVLNGGIRHGVLAMESYLFGLNLSIEPRELEHA
jgi:4,5-DOPA dioxygenase extradiol